MHGRPPRHRPAPDRPAAVESSPGRPGPRGLSVPTPAGRRAGPALPPLHAKAVLIDDTVAVAGSANMDMRSLLLNYEVGLCIYDQDIIQQIHDWMQGLMQGCRLRETHKHAALLLVEDMARLFAPLL